MHGYAPDCIKSVFRIPRSQYFQYNIMYLPAKNKSLHVRSCTVILVDQGDF